MEMAHAGVQPRDLLFFGSAPGPGRFREDVGRARAIRGLTNPTNCQVRLLRISARGPEVPAGLGFGGLSRLLTDPWKSAIIRITIRITSR